MRNKNEKLSILQLFVLVAITILIHSFSLNHTENVAKENWRLLGRVSAGHNGDHDVIHVEGSHDVFRKLKFKVENSPLNMQEMIVRYDDGAPENIEVRNEIPKGGESREIDLKGGKRKLKSVEFWFDTKGILNGKAEVILFGAK